MDRQKFFGRIRIILGSLSILFLILAGLLFAMAVISKNVTEKETTPELPSEVSHRVLFLCSYNPLYFTYEAQVTGLRRACILRGWSMTSFIWTARITELTLISPLSTFFCVRD